MSKLNLLLILTGTLFLLADSTSENLIKTEGTPGDYLSQHLLLYFLIITCLLALQTITLILLGQNLISPTGLRLWWGDVHSPENSQHLTDWYSFSHALHGILMYYFTTYALPDPPITLPISFLIALASGVLWEIVENTPCVIERYRKSAGASAEYAGDSVVNSFCDTVIMSGGFWLAYASPWWVGLILGLGEELLLALVIRDNMVLNFIQIVYPFKCISDWQARGKVGRSPVSQVQDDE